MKKRISNAAYVGACIFAAYVSCHLVDDFGSAYHFGIAAKTLGGVTLFAVLTGALWATIAQFTASLAIERRFSWTVNIVRVLGFIVGMGAGVWGVSGALNDIPGWQVGVAMLIGFIGMCVFGFVTAFAPDRVPESAASH
ncbi:hypothetical protein [Paraburkholderia youngii]|uniref:hypothetical protein n=1 Tax=Paraburkholderia youngii TaxID=2782701 RepID=UPI003D243D7F